MARKMKPYDGNSATAYVAHATNEVIAIYPITPSSNMGEEADEKSARGEKNIWGMIPNVVEMQSEAGAAGAVHGALCAGSLTTTFTASQGLLLMIPNMFKIAGECLPTVFHIAARAVACQGLSIFGDHSDVMSTRSTGWGILASASVQETMDMPLIAQAVTLESRLPFIHMFEGFRVSHEVQKIEELTQEDMRAMIDDDLVRAHRARSMSPDHPTLRGTAQNPDVYFTGRETVNKLYTVCPEIVQKAMDKFAKLTGRQYHLFDYYGAPDAERVIVIIGCGGEVVQETIADQNKNGQKVGLIQVRLYRPWDTAAFIKALPKSVKKIAVLDRTKEPGSLGEPLYQDVVTAMAEAMGDGLWNAGLPVVVGGRYGLGSAEFTPAMVKAVYDNLSQAKPKNHFAVGIHDDVAGTSLPFDPDYRCDTQTYSAMFYGLGSDGTVGANKNTIKIISDTTDNSTQGYFVYDSKKAGSITVSHLRFGKHRIQSPYLITCAKFIACHNFSFVEKYDMLSNLEIGGTFLLASPFDKDTVWDMLPYEMQEQLIAKEAKFYVIDAIGLAKELGLGARINVIMQTVFFVISKVIDHELALNEIRDSIKKTYGKKGDNVVAMNVAAVDRALTAYQQVIVPAAANSKLRKPPAVTDNATAFVKEVTAEIIAQRGADLKVSQIPMDGVWPTATTQYEKRNIANDIPLWKPETCIQCNQCSLVCPHASIRMKMINRKDLINPPATLKTAPVKGKGMEDKVYILQVAPEDCTGCGTCVYNCLAKDKEAIKMVPQADLRFQERANYEYFLSLPETDPALIKENTIKGSQFIRPLFEFSGACAGCGETPYIKLLTQLLGDRALICNATGCSSIYGANLPTTPYCTRADGRGPAWNNSLFEDNAEAAFGMRLSVDQTALYAIELSKRIRATAKPEVQTLIDEILKAEQKERGQVEAQRQRVAMLKGFLNNDNANEKELLSIADYLVRKSVWAVGGDGWAYDIGYGGLDHVLASGKNIKILVLDTEVYSNTGGQASKATPKGAVAKFAASGKPMAKKDLALLAMSYGNIYVARIAMGANPNQVVKAFAEAEAYDGPALVIAYSHCIAHGIDMESGLGEQDKAVQSGHWISCRYNPELVLEGKNPLQLDSKEPTLPIAEYMAGENRFNVLKKSHPEIAEQLTKEAQDEANRRWAYYKNMAAGDFTLFKKVLAEVNAAG